MSAYCRLVLWHSGHAEKLADGFAKLRTRRYLQHALSCWYVNFHVVFTHELHKHANMSIRYRFVLSSVKESFEVLKDQSYDLINGRFRHFHHLSC